MESLELSENYLATYKELIEWRKRAQEIKKLNDKPSTLLRDIYNLCDSISTALKDMDVVGKEICNERRDIKYQLESDNCLYVGKESVRPLIELKNTAFEVFADIRENSKHNEVFTEEIDFSPTYQELQRMRTFANKSKEFIQQLSLATEAIEQLENESEKTLTHQSTLSNTGSDPSTSEFSLFDNSETNVATSSPILNFKTQTF